MPEGDIIFRAARRLDRALAGRPVTVFDTVVASLLPDARSTGRCPRCQAA